MKKHRKTNPRILVVTPEITSLPVGMNNMGGYLRAKAGGLADVSASLVAALFRQGADVHVALPHYRKMFHIDVGNLINNELQRYMSNLHNSRIHLAEDRIFYYCTTLCCCYWTLSFWFCFTVMLFFFFLSLLRVQEMVVIRNCIV